MVTKKERERILKTVKLAEARLEKSFKDLDLAKEAGLTTEIADAERELHDLEVRFARMKAAYAPEELEED